jgi:Predicted metal-dependent hydrolase with the TIM-barrel fold
VSAGTVTTVTGPVAAGELGLVLAHEHVLVRSPGVAETWPRTYPQAEVRRLCVEKLTAARAAGVITIVDSSPYDLGRDPVLLRELSEETGVRIVAASGAWVNPARFFHRREPAEIAELFTAEITEGIAGSGVRAGVVKCAVEDPEPAGPAGRVLDAAALTHNATGVAVSVHTSVARRSGLGVARRLCDAGVPPERILLGHSGDTTDLDLLHELLDTGCFLGMDRFGVPDVLPDAARVATVARLCAEGFAGQLVLSHDANCWSDKDDEERKRAERPDWVFTHVPQSIVPALRAAGVAEADLDLMLRRNPARLLAGTPA